MSHMLAALPDIRFSERVTIKIPSGAGVARYEVDATWRLLPQDEIDAIREANPRNTDAAIQAVALVELFDVVGGVAQPTPYAEEERARVLRILPAAMQLSTAYFAAQIEAGRKTDCRRRGLDR